MREDLIDRAAGLEVVPCRNKREWLRFERCPEALLGRFPQFVPPFPGSIAKFFAPDSAFHRRHGTIFPFLAMRDGRPVGRIAAIVNRSHNTFSGDTTGFFGFFDCLDDAGVARELFACAADELRRQGCTSMRGPYNPSINDECGLMVEGSGEAPVIGLTWNPPYYEKLVLGEGFTRWLSCHGFRLALSELQPPARLRPIAERVMKRGRVRLRPMDLASLPRDLEIILEVYNRTLERNRGFVPITMDDLESASEEFRAIAIPDLIQIAEQDGENAGVALSLPDINQHLHATRRTPWILRPLHFWILLKTRPIRNVRQVVYGISPRFRDRGLHGWLTYAHFVSGKANSASAQLGWIDETNTEILEISELIGGVRNRKWNIYEKSLTQ